MSVLSKLTVTVQFASVNGSILNFDPSFGAEVGRPMKERDRLQQRCKIAVMLAALIAVHLGWLDAAAAGEVSLTVTPIACGSVRADIVTAPCSPNEGIVGNQLITTAGDLNVAPGGSAGYVATLPSSFSTPYGVSLIDIPVHAVPGDNGVPFYDNVFIVFSGAATARPDRPQKFLQDFGRLLFSTVSTCAGDYRVARISFQGFAVDRVKVYVTSHPEASKSYTFGKIIFHTFAGDIEPGILNTKTARCSD